MGFAGRGARIAPPKTSRSTTSSSSTIGVIIGAGIDILFIFSLMVICLPRWGAYGIKNSSFSGSWKGTNASGSGSTTVSSTTVSGSS